jgi:hypothetical protein
VGGAGRAFVGRGAPRRGGGGGAPPPPPGQPPESAHIPPPHKNFVQTSLGTKILPAGRYLIVEPIIRGLGIVYLYIYP